MILSITAREREGETGRELYSAFRAGLFSGGGLEQEAVSRSFRMANDCRGLIVGKNPSGGMMRRRDGGSAASVTSAS
jgi:hypothetical protein